MNNEQIVCNLSFRYKGENKDTLCDVNHTIKKGSCTVLCGSSGCGKSTLLRCINHLIPQFYEGKIKGFCLLNGKDIKDCSVGEIGEQAASVFQDPRSQFFTTDSSSEIAFSLENFGFSHDEIIKRVDNVYTETGFEKLKDRNVFELSSGERQIVAILAAKALDADIFILDEPTANLDLSAVHQLSILLAQLKKQGKTLIISEHRLYYLKEIADEFILMENGRITEKIPASEIINFSEKDLSDRKLRTISLEKIHKKEIISVKPENKTVISAESLSFSYKKKYDKILSEISLQATTGEVLGIIGSNGSGKTTFGKILTGLLKASSGRIFINNALQSCKDLQKNGIFIMQEAEFQFFTNSVINELKYGRKETPDFLSEIESILKEFDMWELRNRHPFSLSGGQMQKLALLLAYFSPKPIVVFDEPTAGLDKKSLISCAEILKKMRKNKIIFIITHDLELISEVCTRCIYLSNGIIKENYDFSENESFSSLVDCMQNRFSMQDNQRPFSKNKNNKQCDPRVKFAYLITVLFITTRKFSLTGVVFFAAVLILLLYEKRYHTAAVGTGMFAAIFILYWLLPPSVTGFIMQYAQVFVLLYMTISAVSENGNSSRITAGLRKLYIPETIIMVAGVIFRFFPVLSRDMNIMKQSMKTRSMFSTLKEKIKAFPEYFEMLVVPVIFRVIRIAETLAASAVTRGIELERKRESYVSLKIKKSDIVMILLLLLCIAFSIISNFLWR